MATAGHRTHVLALMGLSVVVGGCTVHEITGTPLYTLELIDEYGDEQARKVEVTVEIGQGSAGTLELSNVKLAVTPPSPHSLNKLESQLGEVSLVSGEKQRWPEAALRPVPQALPVLNRIQSAIAILQPGDVRIERAVANVFETPPTLGFTRVEIRGSEVSMATVALTAINAKAFTALASVSGRRSLGEKQSEHGFTLEGKRWILGQSAERLRVSGRIEPAAVPATAQEKTVEQ
jgi:hypothetical protein